LAVHFLAVHFLAVHWCKTAISKQCSNANKINRVK
jgi:hypothetical protein